MKSMEELYERLLETPDLHSVPETDGDLLIWRLYASDDTGKRKHGTAIIRPAPQKGAMPSPLGKGFRNVCDDRSHHPTQPDHTICRGGSLTLPNGPMTTLPE